MVKIPVVHNRYKTIAGAPCSVPNICPTVQECRPQSPCPQSPPCDEATCPVWPYGVLTALGVLLFLLGRWLGSRPSRDASGGHAPDGGRGPDGYRELWAGEQELHRRTNIKLEKAEADNKKLSDDLEKCREHGKELAKKLEDMKKQAQKDAAELEECEALGSRLSKAFDDLADQASKHSKNVVNCAEHCNGLKEKAKYYEDEANRLADECKKLKQELDDSGKNPTQLQLDLEACRNRLALVTSQYEAKIAALRRNMVESLRIIDGTSGELDEAHTDDPFAAPRQEPELDGEDTTKDSADDLADCRDQCEAIGRELADSKAARQAAEDKVDKAIQDLAECENICEGMKAQLNSSQAAKKAVDDRNKQLQNQMDEGAKTTQPGSNDANDVDSHKGLADCEEKCNRLQIQLTDAETAKDAAEEKVKNLQKQIKDTAEERTRTDTYNRVCEQREKDKLNEKVTMSLEDLEQRKRELDQTECTKLLREARDNIQHLQNELAIIAMSDEPTKAAGETSLGKEGGTRSSRECERKLDQAQLALAKANSMKEKLENDLANCEIKCQELRESAARNGSTCQEDCRTANGAKNAAESELRELRARVGQEKASIQRELEAAQQDLQECKAALANAEATQTHGEETAPDPETTGDPCADVREKLAEAEETVRQLEAKLATAKEREVTDIKEIRTLRNDKLQTRLMSFPVRGATVAGQPPVSAPVDRYSKEQRGEWESTDKSKTSQLFATLLGRPVLASDRVSGEWNPPASARDQNATSDLPSSPAVDLPTSADGLSGSVGQPARTPVNRSVETRPRVSTATLAPDLDQRIGLGRAASPVRESERGKGWMPKSSRGTSDGKEGGGKK